MENSARIQGLTSLARLGGTMAFEVGRTATNLIELEHPEKRGRNRQNPMNYEEWSKSIELDRTLTPNFVMARLQQIGREDF